MPALSSVTQLCLVPPFSSSSWVLITHPLWWLLTWSPHFALPLSPGWSWFWNPCSGFSGGRKVPQLLCCSSPAPSMVSGQNESAGQLFCLPASWSVCLSTPKTSVCPPWLCWDRTCLSKHVPEVCVALPSLPFLFALPGAHHLALSSVYHVNDIYSPQKSWSLCWFLHIFMCLF